MIVTFGILGVVEMLVFSPPLLLVTAEGGKDSKVGKGISVNV